MELFDKDNNPIEGALSAEEVEARIKDAETKSTEALDSKMEEIKSEFGGKMKEKDDKIQELTDKLDPDLSDEDRNWKETRKALKQLKKDKVDMETAFNKKISEITGTISGGKIEDRISKIAKGDKEFAGKIMVHYNKFAGEPKDEKAIQERLKDATLLAGGGTAKNVLNGDAIRNGGGAIETTKVGKISEEVKGVGSKMGITNEDLKKHE